MGDSLSYLDNLLRAVDAFQEASTHLFLPYISNLPARNKFTDLLFNACSDTSAQEKTVFY